MDDSVDRFGPALLMPALDPPDATGGFRQQGAQLAAPVGKAMLGDRPEQPAINPGLSVHRAHGGQTRAHAWRRTERVRRYLGVQLDFEIQPERQA